MIHVKLDGTSKRVFFLLHGTGGNENDLIPLAQSLDATATTIGLRGNIEEEGMLRYFERYPDGSFDMRSLAKETYALYNTILELIERYNLQDFEKVVIGYSNGSNIALNILKEFTTVFDAMILFHPSPVRPDVPYKNQTNTRLFITSGRNDFFISEEEFVDLAESLKEAGIDTTTFVHEGGHQLVQEELVQAKVFMKNGISM